jgi:protein phosphatase
MTTTNQECRKRRIAAPSARLCAITDPGLSRPQNQDDFYISENNKLLIVADGMGGQAAGEIASALTIEAIVDCMDPSSVPQDPGGRLSEALWQAQTRVLRYSAEHEECRGMGSAVAAGYLRDDMFHVCHAGDVRCYIFAAGVLERATEDHSLAWHLVRARVLTSDEARFHPGKHMLAQAVGTCGHFNPGLVSRKLLDGDRVLLCSDGLWDLLSDDEIAAIMGCDGSMQDIATELADRANSAGGNDNITVLLYQHRAGS